MALHLQPLLAELGETAVFAHHVEPAVADRVLPLSQLPDEHRGDVLVYHASYGIPEITRTLLRRRRLIVVYHNITPSEFFIDHNPQMASELQWGRHELELLRPRVDLAVAVSAYNARDLESMGYEDVRAARRAPPGATAHGLGRRGRRWPAAAALPQRVHPLGVASPAAQTTRPPAPGDVPCPLGARLTPWARRGGPDEDGALRGGAERARSPPAPRQRLVHGFVVRAGARGLLSPQPRLRLHQRARRAGAPSAGGDVVRCAGRREGGRGDARHGWRRCAPAAHHGRADSARRGDRRDERQRRPSSAPHSPRVRTGPGRRGDGSVGELIRILQERL